MKIRIIKYFMVAVATVLALASCQDDNFLTTDQKFPEVLISDTIFQNKIKTKGPFAQKKSEVYFLTNDFEHFHKYTTIKISNPSKTLCQEWFLEDLHEEWFQPFSFQPGDEDGTIHGYYYPWEGTLHDVNQSSWDSDWDYMIFNAAEEPEKGFHIPNYSDINKLSTIISNSAQIRRTLKVDFDGTYQPDLEWLISWHDNGASFWIYPRDPEWFNYTKDGYDPRKVDGCGVILSWYNNNSTMGDGFWFGYTREKTLQCNVRLVRDITKQQW